MLGISDLVLLPYLPTEEYISKNILFLFDNTIFPVASALL
jgi:hypothetical protein